MEKLASQRGNMVQGIRSIGSAALSCCFVAEGSMDCECAAIRPGIQHSS